VCEAHVRLFEPPSRGDVRAVRFLTLAVDEGYGGLETATLRADLPAR